MTIDIQPGDTFTILSNGATFQYRGNKSRSIGMGGAWEIEPRLNSERTLAPDIARQIITAAGHTIKEVQPKYIEPPRPGMFDNPPPPAPVPWPTHAAVNKYSGAITAMGTPEQCEKWANSPTDHYEVRPLAPAPLTPAMRAFIEAFEVYVDRRLDSTEPGAIETELLKAARTLLAEGGAK